MTVCPFASSSCLARLFAVAVGNGREWSASETLAPPTKKYNTLSYI